MDFDGREIRVLHTTTNNSSLNLLFCLSTEIVLEEGNRITRRDNVIEKISSFCSGQVTE